jgi:excisionase family DNA binding protein
MANSRFAKPGDALAIPAEQLWTVADVCAFLRVGRNAVYSMAARRELPSIRVGTRVRFVPEDVRAWLERQRLAGAEVPLLSRTSG